jgi:predicted dehydrogenase
VIGAGGIARQSHLPALRAAALRSRIDIVAVVDSAPDVPAVEGAPLLRHRDALRELAPLDFIDICTPTVSHLELTLWGLGQGYHVVCEKPVALSRAEADRIAAAARAAGRVVMPCHQYRYNPVWIQVKQWLASGALGRGHLAEFCVLLDHGTHLVYQLLDIAGMPAAVNAWTGRLLHTGYDVEDTAALRFEYPGRLALMFFTWAARARENRIRFSGDAGTIEWVGGELRLERDGAVERRDFSAELEKTAYHRWFACLFEAFVAVLDRRDAGADFLEDIRRVASVVEHAYAAAHSGATVALPSDT